VFLIFGGLGAIAAGGFALFAFFAFPNMDSLCENNNLRETLSPDGQFKAVIFCRDCGATTAVSAQVSILPAGRKLPNDGGNVFVANREPPIAVRWIDDHHLRISGDTRTPYLHLAEFHGVHIIYD